MPVFLTSRAPLPLGLNTGLEATGMSPPSAPLVDGFREPHKYRKPRRSSPLCKMRSICVGATHSPVYCESLADNLE